MEARFTPGPWHTHVAAMDDEQTVDIQFSIDDATDLRRHHSRLATYDGHGKDGFHARIVLAIDLRHPTLSESSAQIRALETELEMEQAYRENAERDLTNSAIHAAGIATTLALVTRESAAKDALIVELAAFYADPSNFIIMNDHWYEFGDSNIELTQYKPIGTKARAALAKVQP